MGQVFGRKSSGSRRSPESSVTFLSEWLEASLRSVSPEPMEDSGVGFSKLADMREDSGKFSHPSPDAKKPRAFPRGDHQSDVSLSAF